MLPFYLLAKEFCITETTWFMVVRCMLKTNVVCLVEYPYCYKMAFELYECQMDVEKV